VVALATGAVDTSARLWSASGRLLRTLLGHSDRLGRVAMHPMGAHLATASYDQTWRLWDLETGACLLEQEGHSRSVYAVTFQGDGALAASGGLDAIGTSPSLSLPDGVFSLCSAGCFDQPSRWWPWLLDCTKWPLI
jgi:U4/U6 small nuclear ribonucleoprotein PRP4